MRSLIHATVVTVVVALISPASATPVRVFAVGHKQRLEDVVTYDAFRAKMSALMDAGYPGRSGLVQAGVDDVASHLRPHDPDAPERALVVFPESVGLIAAFIGTRGDTARQQTTAPGAIATLLGTYDAQRQHYAAKFPGQPLVRTLVLALTDTFYRSVYETFRDLAVQHGVYLAVSADLAPARRVDEPGLVALLRDPDEPARSYAYEAVAPRPHNTTFIFAPDGSVLVPDGQGGTRRAPAETDGVLSGSIDKAYLVPIEQPPPGEAAGLALVAAGVADVEVLDTPVGRLGVVISKDAWMPDVNDRLAMKGANVILQPEAFDSWAFTTTEWLPDVFKEGGFANLQKQPEFLLNVNASMTGNLIDITFDGQTAILGRKRKASPGPLGPGNAFVGQNPDTGFLALAPWVVPDPGIAEPSLSLGMRRMMLVETGRLLLPGSGVACASSLAVGACENGYREAIVWTDVDLPDGPVTAAVDPVRAAPPSFSESVRVSGDETEPAAQHAPRIAARGKRVFVVWHEARTGVENVYLAVSRNGGRTFGAPIQASDNPPGTVVEMNPTVAVRGKRVAVVWQEFANGHDDDEGRVQMAVFDPRGRKRGGDVRVDDADPGGKWMPAIAFAGRRPVVAWIDERDVGPEGQRFAHVYAARAERAGDPFAASVRVDAGEPVPLSTHHDNKWSPAIVAHADEVAVAWTDFRSYAWELFLARSTDGGATFGENARVDDAPTAVERIHERPALAIGEDDVVHAVWADLRSREPDTNIFHARSEGAGFSTNRQVDYSSANFDPDRDTPSNQWHPSLAADGERLWVVWQDNRLGNDDVFFAASVDGGRSFTEEERVDDTGGGSSEQSRPSLAIAGAGRRRRCLVVWEDDRNGNADVYLARRDCG